MTAAAYFAREVARRVARGDGRRHFGSDRLDVGVIVIPSPEVLAECVPDELTHADAQWLRARLADLEASA